MRAIALGIFLLGSVVTLGGCATYVPSGTYYVAPRVYVEPTPYYSVPVPGYWYNAPLYRPRYYYHHPHSQRLYPRR